MKHVISFLLSVFFLLASASCSETPAGTDTGIINYRKEMRVFIEGISAYAKNINSRFLIIPQNGQSVAWDKDADTDSNGVPCGIMDSAYTAAIDGTGREDMFYGYDTDDKETPDDVRVYLSGICKKFLEQGKSVLSVDYCSSLSKISDSYAQNASRGFIGFAEPDRGLGMIPEKSGYSSAFYPYNGNTNDIQFLSDAKNFLFLLNMSSKDGTGSELVKKIAATDYDVVIMDAFINGSGMQYTASLINELKTKAHGGRRLIIAYMSIGEAEDYRWYWNASWVKGTVPTDSAPAWLDAVNPDWAGNYKVKYWNKDWQSLMYGNDSSYVKKILDAGFDGVYLDIVDAYEYYEE